MRTFLSQFIVPSLLCCSGIFTSSTHADIIVAIENVTTSVTNPTGTAITADVSVSWDDTVDPSVNVDYASLKFLIQPPSGAMSSLAFLNPQHNLQLVDPAYLFLGNSVAITNGTAPGTVSTTTSLNDTYTAFDTRDNNLTDVRLGTLARLIFRLDLVAFGTPVGSESFSIALQSADSLFEDNNDDPITFTLQSGTQGVITLSGATAAVPEPATCVALLFGTGIWAWHNRRLRLKWLHAAETLGQSPVIPRF